MKNKILACALMGVLALVGFVAVEASGGNKNELKQFSVIQEQTVDHSAVYLTNRVTHEVISVVNSEKDGTFIAFYPKESEKRNRSNSLPSLAFTSDGLQIVPSDGKVRFISLDELARLDSVKGTNTSGGGAQCNCGAGCKCDDICLCGIKK